MVHYRRNPQKGARYFFTVALRDRRSRLLIEHIDLLRQAMRQVQEESFYEIQAIVILPDHIHALWKLPDNDHHYSFRWRKIKNYFTRALRSKGLNIQKDKRGEYKLWQRRFWEHTICDDQDFENHVNYIHYNPVKHGLVKQVCEWPYSSFHRYVEKKWLNLNWGNELKLDRREVLFHYGE